MPKSINNSTNNLTTGEAKLLVLLIGVDRYQDEGLHNLNFCAKDSRQLGEAIATATKLFPQKQIVFYDDSSPNKLILNNVRRGLDDLVAAAGELDTVLIYFSGHGILEPDTKQPFLCLEDTNTEDLINTGLPVRELLAKLAASGAKYQLLFLDACHSGGVNFQDLVAQRKGAVKNESLPVNPTPELINLLQQRASKSQGFYALLSCDKNQRSLELPQLQHGLFTYYLIRAFLGEAADKKGVITADALYQYVYRELIAYIDKNNYQIKLINQQKRSRNELEREPYEPQVPRRIVEGAGEFILGFIPGVAGGNNFGKNDRLGLIVNAVSDCEEVVNLAGILSSRGGFEMDYFSGGVREALRMQHRSWGDALGAIKRCLRWEERSRQDFASACSTAFLYFRAAMETSPEGESYLLFGDGARLSQTALRKLLRNSKMGRVAIALDCPDACQTDLDEWVEDLRGAEIPSLCLLAVAPKSENSGEFAAALGRVLADAKAGFTVAEAIASLQREIKAPPFSTDKTLPPPFPTDKTLPPPFSTDKTLPPPFSRGAGGDRIPFTPWLSGGIIELLLPEGKTGVTFDSGIPPYRGLLAFRKKDAFYFHGRETLAREIVTRLQGESFLAVVGASGSGKSSVVQAGALPLLEAGTQLPGKCWTLCLRPGREPLCSLARALASSPGEAKRLEGLLHLGVDNFVWELQQREEPTVVLVVDQFEELFALAGELERREFLTLLLGALARMPHRLKVVITLRDDFISACLEVRELAARVQESFLLVRPSLEEEEYRRAIVEPARKVGLSLEEGLVETLLAEVRDAGLALPLLQFALQQLWECRQGPTLTLQLYHERVGGLKGVLEKRADEVLGQFGEEERECARWIFLSLVRLGEGREDTRRRVLRSELLVDKYDKGAMMWVLRRLSEERLVIVGGESPQAPRGAGGSGDGESGSPEAGSPQAPLEKGGSGVPEVVGSKVTLGKGGSGVPEVVGSKAPLVKGGLGGSQVSVETPKSKTTLGKGDLEELEVSVEIAHEILIRHWSTLRWWLEENRTRLQQQRQAEGEGKKWERQGRSPDFLPRGAALRQAEELYLKYAEELSPLTREFVEEAMRLEKREEMARRQQRQRTISGLVGGLVAVSLLAAGAVWQWRRAVVGERNAEISARMATLESLPRTSLEQQLDVIALGKELGQDWVSFENRVRGTVLLQQTFDFESWKESNRLKGHQLWVSHVTFSPDGNLIATASSDNTVRLWKPDGTKVATLKGHQAPVSHVTFSPDSNLIATASDDETVRLWKPDGTKVATLKGHTEPVWQVTFSPDGNLIATASDDETARLWKPDGTKVATLKGHTEPVWQVTFSPDGNLIATASDDET
ncbi:MAG: caspase family protein, partial [Cyanobacteriota bacterium]|nr:caspase family protein [Cyanobacteriota bacterium]